jgi:hypothetical protein
MSNGSMEISGNSWNPGKYMSIEKGPIAESKPRMSISKNLFFLFVFIISYSKAMLAILKKNNSIYMPYNIK